MGKVAVVALGGNAITRSGQAGTFDEQAENAAGMVTAICRMREAGWHVVIVHGNGPQVGNLAVQQRQAADLLPPQPLFQLGAMTQGELGSLSAWRCAAMPAPPARARSRWSPTPASRRRPGVRRPTKPIGPFLDAAGPRRAEEQGWVGREDPGRGHRRVVPSPQPLEILESDAIGALAERGFIVVARAVAAFRWCATASGSRVSRP